MMCDRVIPSASAIFAGWVQNIGERPTRGRIVRSSLRTQGEKIGEHCALCLSVVIFRFFLVLLQHDKLWNLAFVSGGGGGGGCLGFTYFLALQKQQQQTTFGEGNSASAELA